MKTAIVIPALNPGPGLVALVRKLQNINDAVVVVVDDGSGEEYQAVFDELQNTWRCLIWHMKENMGKGAALKTGIRLAMLNYPGLLGVVTADADGQHLYEDIAKVAGAIKDNPSGLILGVRDLSAEGVPFKSRWGNRITSAIFRLTTGIRCPDTQTGLRGIPASLFDFCLSVPGSRYEYEMNILTAAAKRGMPLVMLPITTVYIEDNRSSHFNPVKDSARIYFNFLKFGISSAACAVFDLTAFTLLTYTLFGKTSTGILSSTIIARCLSGVLNFIINKKWCFKNHEKDLKQAVEYAALFCAQMALSWAFVSSLSVLPINLTVIKMLIDGMLFFVSYFVQSRVIFKKNHTHKKNFGSL